MHEHMKWMGVALAAFMVTFGGVLTLGNDTAQAHQARAGELQAGQDASVKVTPALAAQGQELFRQRCLICHLPFSDQWRQGPGLKGLFKLKETPAMKHPVSEAAIREHIQKGGPRMPAFTDIKGKDLEALIAFLKTL